MKSFDLYECKAAKVNRRLCYLSLKFTEEKNLNAHFGRIETAFFHPDPQDNATWKKHHTNAQSWYKNHDGNYCMGITRFALPPSLQGIGLGPVVWSEIFKGLPGTVRGNLKIFGSLNSGDAFTPQTDSDGKILFETKNGERTIKLLNQINRRNRFWEGMLTPVDNGTPPLKCDEAGNGAFTGYFKDPMLNCSTNKILLSKALTEEDTGRVKLFKSNAA